MYPLHRFFFLMAQYFSKMHCNLTRITRRWVPCIPSHCVPAPWSHWHPVQAAPCLLSCTYSEKLEAHCNPALHKCSWENDLFKNWFPEKRLSCIISTGVTFTKKKKIDIKHSTEGAISGIANDVALYLSISHGGFLLGRRRGRCRYNMGRLQNPFPSRREVVSMESWLCD